MKKIGKYKISFDTTNPNCILIHDGQRLHNAIACPPIEKGCDIINFGDIINDGYTYNFGGLILITNKSFRRLYYEGEIIALAKRNK